MQPVSEIGGYTVIAADEFEFTAPSKGDQRRGVMRLSPLLRECRANVWRMPPSTQGRRHRETTQEEIFVCLEGAAMLLLGDPPEAVELAEGTIAIVGTSTPVQMANRGAVDAVVLIVGAPATTGDAEYLPDASAGLLSDA